MVKDRSLLRPQVRTTLGASEAGAGRMLVELRPLTLRTLCIRKACIEEETQTGSVIRKRFVEIEDGELLRLHRRGGKYLNRTLPVPSRQGIVA